MLNSSCFDSVEDYLKFYGLGAASAGYEFVPFKSNGFDRLTAGGFELAGHTFVPKDYKATVFILHGYLGHCGLLSKLVKYLTEAGFAVAAFDLPGHGLSSGETTAIDDFSQYTNSLDAFLNIIRQKLKGPYHIIGHSTGAAIIMDYLLGGTSTPLSTSREDCFDKVILTAPLERSDWWVPSKIGVSICRPFCSNLPRVFRKVSSDKDFLRFVQYKDPLQAKKVSVRWINAMFNWDKKIANAKTSHRPVLVIQGTKDNIIDWKFNIKFILSKFKNTEVELIINARHELFNESADIRKEVFSQINSYLEN